MAIWVWRADGGRKTPDIQQQEVTSVIQVHRKPIEMYFEIIWPVLTPSGRCPSVFCPLAS